MTLPAGWQLGLPAGIDAESTRALLALLEARFGALPVERVLVWHLASVVESALPHLADGLGITDLQFIDVPPRDFIAQGIDLMRRRGTAGAVESALAAIGYDASVVELEEDTRLYYDGSITYSGEPHNYGDDGEWIRWRAWIDADGLTTDEQYEIWDVLTLMNRAMRPFVLVVRASDGVLTARRSRADITDATHTPSGIGLPYLWGASYTQFRTDGAGAPVVIMGVELATAVTVTVDDIDVVPSSCDASSVTFVPPAHVAAGPVLVTVTTLGGTSNALTCSYVAPPVLVSLDHDLVDTAGGDTITISGTGLTDATVQVSTDAVGTSWTDVAPTSNSSTDVAFDMLPRAAGTYVARVVTPGGPSNMLSIEAWSPAQLATGPQDTFLDANRGVTIVGGKVSPWASQGTTPRACTQATAASQPVQTAGVFGGRPGITFDGLDDSLVTPVAVGPIATYSSFAVARWTSARTAVNTPSVNVPLTIVGSTGWGGFGVSAGQVAWKNYDKPLVLRGAGLNDGAPHLIGVTCSATEVRLFADGAQQGATYTPANTDAYFSRVAGGRFVPDGALGDDFFGEISAPSSSLPASSPLRTSRASTGGREPTAVSSARLRTSASTSPTSVVPSSRRAQVSRARRAR